MTTRKVEVDRRIAELGGQILEQDLATEYAYRYRLRFGGDLRKLSDYIEDIDGAEILSIGHGLELIKDLGDAGRVSQQYSLPGFNGTHVPYNASPVALTDVSGGRIDFMFVNMPTAVTFIRG